MFKVALAWVTLNAFIKELPKTFSRIDITELDGYRLVFFLLIN